MGLNFSDLGELYKQLKLHVGHELVCTNYGDGDNIAIECEDCGEVLVDANRPEQGTFRVEWHLDYTGGDTKLTGNFADIEPDPEESVERAFERVTGHSRVHIIHYEHKDIAA